MKNAVLGARVILGAVFILFGLNYFVPLFSVPESTPEGGAFLGALFTTGYMFPLIKVTEMIGGILVLSGLVPLGLLFLAPVAVNIFAFHLMLAPVGMALPLVLVLLMLFLAWSYRDKFAPLFTK